MNKKLTRTLTAALLLTGAIAFGLSAQPGGDRPQGEDGPPPLDLAAAAITLNVTEDALVAALGVPADRPEGGPEGGGSDQTGHERPVIDFTAAAETLGVSEEALVKALGTPEEGLQSNSPPQGEYGPRDPRR